MKSRQMLKNIASMILGMPFSGSVDLIKVDMNTATDDELINEIYHNLKNVNKLANESNKQRDVEFDRLKDVEADVNAMRRLFSKK